MVADFHFDEVCYSIFLSRFSIKNSKSFFENVLNRGGKALGFSRVFASAASILESKKKIPNFRFIEFFVDFFVLLPKYVILDVLLCLLLESMLVMFLWTFWFLFCRN